MEKRTTKPEYAPFIVQTVRHLLESNREQIIVEVFSSMEHMLHPADLEVLVNDEPRWRNQVEHMLDGLIEDGVVLENNGLLRVAEP
jgi:hypothetical protein